MSLLTTVDRFGRVVIPKETREHYGLGAGTPLTIVDAEDGILLKPSATPAPLIDKGGVLVCAGRTTTDPGDAVSGLRRERLGRFMPRRGR